MSSAKRAPDFEWTFSTRTRERECCQCRSMTAGFLTNLRNGVRKPFCSTCFFAAMKQVAPNSAPHNRPGTRAGMEQLPLC
jgi:hypothetical protein